MKVLLALVMAYGTLALAAPGSYEGGGTIGIPGKDKAPYTVKLNVTEVEPGKLFNVEETYISAGKTSTFSSQYRFQDDGTVLVSKNGTKIGCGYYFSMPDGSKWTDYRQETDMGLLHVNMYYNAATQQVVRMGDIIALDGVRVWTDSLKLAK